METPRELAKLASAWARLPALFLVHPKASERFWEFFIAKLQNKNTRLAYYKAACRFSEWCDGCGLDLAQVKPIHVAAYIEELLNLPMGRPLSKPTVKQHLAALRMLFDWLVVGHIMDVNPAHAVHGPKHSQKTGKTTVLNADEARALLDRIRIVKKVRQDDGTIKEEPDVVGLRDRALIGLMVFAFARVGAAAAMKVEDYFIQGRRRWVRLHEKGGKCHDVPANHKLDEYLEAYIEGAGLAKSAKGPLFRTAEWQQAAPLTLRSMSQSDVYRMIGRRAEDAGIKTKIGCHTFRATGITAYLKNGGRLEIAQQIAAHESSRTTGLYDRRGDDVSVDEVERIRI
jgi:site-specific recombinase XerD